jgi:NADH-quinone oxidoreductase subunit M
MRAGFPYLTYLVLVPMGAAIIAAVLPRKYGAITRLVGVIGSILTLALAVTVLVLFKTEVAGYQLTASHQWVSSLGISWSLGVDGISLFLMLLTVVLVPLGLYGAPERANERASSPGCCCWRGAASEPSCRPT